MKPTLLYLLLAMALSSCVQSTVTRVREDGAKEVIHSYGLSERAGSFADAYARYRLRMPQPEK